MNSSELTILRQGILKDKPALSVLYEEWYALIRDNLAVIEGQTLELGSGGGFLKNVIPGAITSDVLEGVDVDIILDAKKVGDVFPHSLSNIVLVNVFHHINDSAVFINSVLKALKPGGRILMIEPSYNIWSSLVYSVFRHEPFLPNQDSWSFVSSDPLKDSNQAQSWIVFKRDRIIFERLYPELNILSWHFLMPFSYMATGGLSFNSPVGKRLIVLLRRFEKKLLDSRFGIFSFIVIERSHEP